MLASITHFLGAVELFRGGIVTPRNPKLQETVVKASILTGRGQAAACLRSASVAAEDVVLVGYSFRQVVGIECFSFRVVRRCGEVAETARRVGDEHAGGQENGANGCGKGWRERREKGNKELINWTPWTRRFEDAARAPC